MSGLVRRIIVIQNIGSSVNQDQSRVGNNNQNRDKEIEQLIIRDVINSIDIKKGKLRNEPISN